MIVLSYRGKTLRVDAEIIETFTDMEITRQATIKEKEQAVNGSAAKASYADVSAIKADSVSLEVPLSHGAGVDVENEVSEWRALVDGESARVYFAGRDFLGVNVTLSGCDATEISFDGNGVWTRAKLKLTFTQSETGKATAASAAKGNSSGGHGKYHTYVEAWAVNALTKKKTRISTVKSGTREAGEKWKQPTAPSGFVAPTEYRAKQYEKKDCPFCKGVEQLKAVKAAIAGKEQSKDSVFTPTK